MCVYNIHKLYTDTQYLLWLCYYCTWILYCTWLFYIIVHGYCIGYCIVAFMNRPAHLLTYEQFDGTRDKGVPQSICLALWKEQPVAELAPLAADDSVLRVVGIVQDAPQFVVLF